MEELTLTELAEQFEKIERAVVTFGVTAKDSSNDPEADGAVYCAHCHRSVMGQFAFVLGAVTWISGRHDGIVEGSHAADAEIALCTLQCLVAYALELRMFDFEDDAVYVDESMQMELLDLLARNPRRQWRLTDKAVHLLEEQEEL